MEEIILKKVEIQEGLGAQTFFTDGRAGYLCFKVLIGPNLLYGLDMNTITRHKTGELKLEWLSWSGDILPEHSNLNTAEALFLLGAAGGGVDRPNGESCVILCNEGWIGIDRTRDKTACAQFLGINTTPRNVWNLVFKEV